MNAPSQSPMPARFMVCATVECETRKEAEAIIAKLEAVAKLSDVSIKRVPREDSTIVNTSYVY